MADCVEDCVADCMDGMGPANSCKFSVLGKLRVKARSVQDADVKTLVKHWSTCLGRFTRLSFQASCPKMGCFEAVHSLCDRQRWSGMNRFVRMLGLKTDTLSQTHIDIDGLKPI